MTSELTSSKSSPQKPSLLLYLHGFNSSPESQKAQIMKKYCQQHRPDIKFFAPQLPNFPLEAEVFLTQFMDKHINDYKIGVVGSSLGGFLSTWINDRYQERHKASTGQSLKAVIVNPAVNPHITLAQYLGEQQNMYNGTRYVLEEKHIGELAHLHIENLRHAEDFWVLLQTNDEVLDYQEAVVRYGDKQCLIEQGGDHGFVGFERFPEKIVDFLSL